MTHPYSYGEVGVTEDSVGRTVDGTGLDRSSSLLLRHPLPPTPTPHRFGHGDGASRSESERGTEGVEEVWWLLRGYLRFGVV